MSQNSPSTWADYRAAVTRFTDAIDIVLEQGRVTQARYDAFCACHGIQPGAGAEKLTADSVPPGNRYLHRRLIALTESLYTQLLGPTPAHGPSVARTAPRALASRNRI